MSIASYKGAYLEIFRLESNYFLRLFCLIISSFTACQTIAQFQCLRNRVCHFPVGSDRLKILVLEVRKTFMNGSRIVLGTK